MKRKREEALRTDVSLEMARAPPLPGREHLLWRTCERNQRLKHPSMRKDYPQMTTQKKGIRLQMAIGLLTLALLLSALGYGYGYKHLIPAQDGRVQQLVAISHLSGVQ